MPSLNQARERLAQYYLDRARDIESHFIMGFQPLAMSEFALDWDQVRLLAGGDPFATVTPIAVQHTAFRCLTRARNVFLNCVAPLERIAWLICIVSCARHSADTSWELDALEQLATAHLQYGETETAVDRFREALLIARAIGENVASILGGLGDCYRKVGNMTRALDCYSELAAATADSPPDERDPQDRMNLRVTAFIRAGLLAMETKDFDAAGRNFAQAEDLAEDWNNPLGKGAALANWGSALLEQGRYRDALPILQEALAIIQSFNSPRDQARILLAAAQCLWELGQSERACTYAEASATLLKEIDDPQLEDVFSLLARWRGSPIQDGNVIYL